jgi:hypothetical protein
MEIKELRIGNLVWEDYSGNMLVSQINYSTDSVFLRKGWLLTEGRYLCNGIQPIPLNEDWLLKFGFRKRKACGNYWFEKKIKGILFLTNDINPKIGFAYSIKLEHVFIHDMNGAARFKHVHLLQNIVFALTGTELEMK